MTATDTYLLLRAFCDELARCGMGHACTSPGSRSTPLVLSLVREPRIRCWSHIDERCAGFFALGAAKASGRPGGGHLHLRDGGGQPRAGGDRGLPGAGAADRPHRRPAARAARGRRRADDRPGQALRRRGQVVLRGRRARRHAGAPALDPHARLPGVLDRARPAAPGRCTSTSRCASRWSSTAAARGSVPGRAGRPSVRHLERPAAGAAPAPADLRRPRW